MKSRDKDNEKLPKHWIGCETEAAYFGEERKSGKVNRKMISAKDRSQYKKTDQRQLAKKREEYKGSDSLIRGRVISIASHGIMVETEGHIFSCALRGILKKEKSQFKNLVTVGDFVLYEKMDDREGMIVHVEPRLTVLSRAENLSRRKEQLIAANIDQVLITVSVVSPKLKPPLVDRYIIATQKGGMVPIIVVNKIDFFDATKQGEELKAEMELYHEFLTAYQAAGVLVIPVSAITGKGIEVLKELMKDKASVFSGQSGVGKSSLINAVTGKNLRIGDLVERTNKGSHTTSAAQLIPLEKGGWCIDTPGIKSFGVWDLDKEVIEHYFPEIFSCGAACKFPDCSHTHEVDCAVLNALEKGKISRIRYESYQALIQSVSENHIRR